MRAKNIMLTSASVTLVSMMLALIMLLIPVAYAEESGLDASSSSSATGAETHVDASAKYSDNRVTATTEAKASGDSITLSSRASAQGYNVRGKGSASVSGRETSSKIDVIVDKISEGITRVTVIVNAFASGNAHGETYASAWADNNGNGDNGNGDSGNGDNGNGDSGNGGKNHIAKSKVEENPAFRGGFTFGKNDAERYYHFKHQIEEYCSSSDEGNSENGAGEKNNTCLRARYFVSIILNDHGVNTSDFELKYPLEDLIRANPSLVEGKEGK